MYVHNIEKLTHQFRSDFIMDPEEINLDALTDDFDGCSDVDDDGDGDYDFINEGGSSQLSAGSEFLMKNIKKKFRIVLVGCG